MDNVTVTQAQPEVRREAQEEFKGQQALRLKILPTPIEVQGFTYNPNLDL